MAEQSKTAINEADIIILWWTLVQAYLLQMNKLPVKYAV
jgi:hypothetical protein